MKGELHRVARNQKNCIELRSLTVLIEMDELFIHTVQMDEATLSSLDNKYRKTVSLEQVGEIEDEKFIKIVFPGVVPGKKYTLIYDTNLDSIGEIVTKVILFQNKFIQTVDLVRPLRLDSLIEDLDDEFDKSQT